MRYFLSLFVIFIFSVPAFADPLPEDIQSDLDETRAEFITALETLDYEGMVEIIPPRIIQEIAKQNAVSPQALKASMTDMFSTQMSGMGFDDIYMGEGPVDATMVNEGGETYYYGFVPTTGKMYMDGELLGELETQTLVLWDSGEWYLVRIDNPGLYDLVKSIYPFLSDTVVPE